MTPLDAPLVDTLETPVPVVDLDVVERNLAKMQAYADAHGLRLRPHIKTHKLPRFAQRQMALGAAGITCQKLGEAEVMADAGLDDILISFPLIGPGKAARLAALARRVTRLQVAADSLAALDTAAQAARDSGRVIEAVIEFDSGARRTGVGSAAEAVALAAAARERGLSCHALMTYPAGPATAEFFAAARSADRALTNLSAGGTPNARHMGEVAGVTEMRVGTYIYNDRTMVGFGAATLDECALQVHATVVSRPAPERAILDAGSKTLSSDLLPPDLIQRGLGTGYGMILEYPGAVIERVNEEHGMVDLSACEHRPRIGERVRIVPNHVCVVTNLHDHVVLAQRGVAREIISVAARGRTR